MEDPTAESTQPRPYCDSARGRITRFDLGAGHPRLYLAELAQPAPVATAAVCAEYRRFMRAEAARGIEGAHIYAVHFAPPGGRDNLWVVYPDELSAAEAGAVAEAALGLPPAVRAAMAAAVHEGRRPARAREPAPAPSA